MSLFHVFSSLLVTQRFQSIGFLLTSTVWAHFSTPAFSFAPSPSCFHSPELLPVIVNQLQIATISRPSFTHQPLLLIPTPDFHHLCKLLSNFLLFSLPRATYLSHHPPPAHKASPHLPIPPPGQPQCGASAQHAIPSKTTAHTKHLKLHLTPALSPPDTGENAAWCELSTKASETLVGELLSQVYVSGTSSRADSWKEEPRAARPKSRKNRKTAILKALRAGP